MEDTITPNPVYVQGFNEGYLIAMHIPEFSTKPLSSEGLGFRGQGFQDGQKQFIFEKDMDKLLYRNKEKDQGKDKDRSKDDYERE